MPTERRAGDLLVRRRNSQRGFYRALGAGAPDSRVVDLTAEVQATLVPARPWFSIFNAVCFTDVERLRATLPRLPTVYGEGGVHAWSVWVAPDDTTVTDELERAAYRLEAEPLAMGADLAALDLEPRRHLDFAPDASFVDVARCNDRAHGVLEDWTMAAVFTSMRDASMRVYAATRDGTIATSLLARHLDGDCYFWFVATVPEAQGQGLASELMRHALRDARREGCTTSTLESTKAGEHVYAKLGFAALGRCGRWTCPAG